MTTSYSLYLLPEAVDELVRAGVNPLDLVAEHLRQSSDTSVHALPTGESIGVMREDGRIVMLAVPRSLTVRQIEEMQHGQAQRNRTH